MFGFSKLFSPPPLPEVGPDQTVFIGEMVQDLDYLCLCVEGTRIVLLLQIWRLAGVSWIKVTNQGFSCDFGKRQDAFHPHEGISVLVLGGKSAEVLMPEGLPFRFGVVGRGNQAVESGNMDWAVVVTVEIEGCPDGGVDCVFILEACLEFGVSGVFFLEC